MNDRGYIFVSVRSINATLHKKIKDLVPKRYRFTLQSTLFEEKDQDIGTVYHLGWPLERAKGWNVINQRK